MDKADATQLPLTGVSEIALARWVRGTVERIRTRGGIHHDWLRPYLEKNANRYNIWGGRPRGQGMPGGIVEKEAAIPTSKVMLLCPSCKKATRVAHKFLEDGQKSRKVRACKKCGATFDN